MNFFVDHAGWLAALAGVAIALGIVWVVWLLSRRTPTNIGVHRTPSSYSALTEELKTAPKPEAFPKTAAYGVVRPNQFKPNELGGGIPSMWERPRHLHDVTAEMPAVRVSPRHHSEP